MLLLFKSLEKSINMYDTEIYEQYYNELLEEIYTMYRIRIEEISNYLMLHEIKKNKIGIGTKIKCGDTNRN